MKPKISIIIVHYRVKKVLFNCLESISAHKPKASFEIIVVDNDETKKIQKDLTKQFPLVKYIKSPGNLGYAAGNNLGAKTAKGKYLFILNPDTQILPGSIDKLVKFLEKNKSVAVVAPLLLNHRHKPYPLQGTSILTPLKGVFALSFINKLFPNNPVSKNYWSNWQDKTKLNQPRQVDVVPGSAFLIRKSIFNKLKGFDENFFLYFEESDLGKRLTDKGYKLFILPQAKIIHHWAAVTPKSSAIKQHFNRSRYYYFKKHYGLLAALMAEFFTRLSLSTIILSLILLLATWLRFYRLSEVMTFFGDQGRDYLAARDMLLTGKWPLVGIPSSVPWLHQGSFFIWLAALALKIGEFNPISPAILTATLGVLTAYLTYTLTRHWFSKSASLIASLIMATAPLAVIHSRMPYHTSPIPLFSLLFIFSTYFWAKNKLHLFWPIFLWAILLQFELTAAPLILINPLIRYWQKKPPTKQDVITFLSATIIPFLPKIIYDLTHGFKQTLGFITWLGYRFVSFFGFSGRHTVSTQSIKQVSLTIFEYWHKFISWGSLPIAIILGLLVITTILYRLKKPLSLRLKILFSFIVINFLAFYLHQGPSEAYFPVLFPAWVLLIAWLIDYLKKPFITIFFIILSFYNTHYLIIHDFIPYGPTLTQRLSIAKFINLQTQGQSFKLKNYPTDEHASHLDSYRYLLWWLNSPEDPRAKLSYTIYEGKSENFISPSAAIIYHFDNIKLIKHD